MDKQIQYSFAEKLARLIQSGVPLVYFDETSFNLWLRNRKTWTFRDMPVKWVFNKARGHNITVYGGISAQLKKPVFMQAKST